MSIQNGNIPMQYQASYQASTDGFSNFMDSGLGGLADVLNPQRAEERAFERAEVSANNHLLRDLYIQNNANQFNAEQAQIQRDFEKQMSDTAYQRAVEDMKKAGINPIMALSNGGAEVPQGASASASSARSGGANSSSINRNSIASVLYGVFSIASGLISGKTDLAVAGIRRLTELEKTDKKLANRNYYTEFYNSKGKRTGTKYVHY